MMLVSRGADYAIRAMLDVARLPEDKRTVTEQIAMRQEIPVAFLSKVIAQLTQAGLMRTYRGAAGGVHLGRPAEEINLRQIVEALQGPIALSLCTDPYDGCPKAATCPAYRVFKEGQRNLDTLLEEECLADLVREATILKASEKMR
jgi:Rrf2 family protein